MSGSEDIFRILISTDNHLGVWEKDEIRKDDSFVSFEEVFEIAHQQDVDCVLLGGDLFHDNKPSRHTIVRAMDILGKHCLNNRPVAFQVLSDQEQNFVNGKVNFENPNYNVGLPVFTIHGNHDDPAGAENLSAVDILSSCNLVNYFGKTPISGTGVGKVRISPVLLRKGDTKLALYGLGNLRDERLARLFQTPGCVEWVRPADTAEISRDDWFSVFVLHQNRVMHGQSVKNTVRESFLARFLDLVVWGHEHECVENPRESAEAGGEFSVLQPGSSVATALSEGEARCKHVFLLEIMGQSWRTIKFPLETVRPFVFESLVLGEVRPELDPEKPEELAAHLEQRVAEMVEKAERGRNPRTPQLPLVRLRVDYTGFSTINTQRFGQKFVGKVANPHDIILWQKATKRKEKAEPEYGDAAKLELVRPEALDEARIEDLIAQHLTATLEILPENDLSLALHEFVEKDNKSAISETVQNVLKENQSAILRDDRSTQIKDEGGLPALLSSVSKTIKQASQATTAVRRPSDGAGASASAGRQQAQQDGAELAHEDDDDTRGPSTSGRPRAAAATPARGGAAAKGGARPPKVPGSAAKAAGGGGKGRQAKLDLYATGGLRQSSLNFEPTGGSQRGGRAMSEGLSSDGPAPAPATRRPGSTRAAAGRAQKKMAASAKQNRVVGDDDESGEEVQELDLLDDEEEEEEEAEVEEINLVDSDEEQEEVAPSRKRGRGAAAASTPAAKRRAAAAAGAAAAAPKFGGGASAHMGSLADSEDEEGPAPVQRRGRLGGDRLAGGGSQQQQQQQPTGTGSQQVSRGWGALR